MISFKRITYFLFAGVILLVSLYSCKGVAGYLNRPDKQKLTNQTQWSTQSNADIFLNDVYDNLKILYNQPESLDNFTDFNDAGFYYTSWNWKKGIVSTDNNYTIWGGDTGPGDITNWNETYTKVRKANTFIKQVKKHSKNFSATWMHKRIDEARFLRAFWYTRLWMHVGGIPIITQPLHRATMDSSQIYNARATFKQTYDFLVTQLDSIINDDYLAVKYNKGDKNAGRATLGAARMLKGWIQLYAASPAYNAPVPAVGSNPNKCCGFGNYKVSRWAAAAKTFKKFIDQWGDGHPYSLFPNLKTLWYTKNEYNSSVIWDRQIVANTSQGSSYEQYGGPVWINGSYYTWGNYDPTQELVNKFYMANGKPISASNSGYDPQNPYKNRGQRFYDWIVYNGAPYDMNWMSKPDTIYTWINKVHPSKNQIDFDSKDVGNTGYYSKKKLNPNVRPGGGAKSGQNWIYFRYAEVLLGYAEAENEAVGPNASVYNAVNKVRHRAGLPDLQPGMSQAAMRKEIHQERDVEFCYENKRFWDIIRWGIADSVMNQAHHAMKIYNTHPSDNSGKWVHKV
ncbi:MAG TPA: RagB/SusD family nutrient uptake outer membrane protein, partial [Balneolaceae bacterium]|nr:RagB/SusD family nutrient uptake outer membrane protein [Balneolaceae bacterium]